MFLTQIMKHPLFYTFQSGTIRFNRIDRGIFADEFFGAMLYKGIEP